MIVGHLDIVGVAAFPSETNAPLIVDTDALLTCTITVQRLQSIRWRHAQKVQGFRGIQGLELDIGATMHVRRKAAHTKTGEEGGCSLVSEALDHRERI
jgi:hypothetical protein